MTSTSTPIDLVSGREDAFAQLVRRHAGWVYGVAQRRLRDSHLAEDAVQATFALLFRKAPPFAAEPAAVAWLHRTVCYASANILRSERRRRKREHEAHLMRQQVQDPEARDEWEKLAPMLDELIEKLSRGDREAVLLRFYRQLTHEQVAAELGISEEAARKRVTRAVERLRKLAGARGATTTVAALTALLVAHAPASAPAGIAAAAITIGLSGATGSAVAGGAVASVMHGVQVTAFLSYAKVATIVLLIATACTVASVGLVAHLRARGDVATAPGLVGRLSDGATFELVGVGRRAERGKAQWWAADGSPVAIAPYVKVPDVAVVGASILAYSATGSATQPQPVPRQTYEVAFRRWHSGPDAANVSWIYTCPEAAGGGQFGYRPQGDDRRQRGKDAMLVGLVSVPAELSAATIRGEVATGEWSTLHEFTVDADLNVSLTSAATSQSTTQPAPIVAKLGNDGRLFVSVGYENPTGDPNTTIDQRLIVASEDGKRRSTYIGRASHNGTMCVAMTSIDKGLVPRGKQRLSLQFQVRPFDRWIEFRNVSLKPDATTHVQVVTSDAPTHVGKLRSGPSVELLGVAYGKPLDQAWRADGSKIDVPLAHLPWFEHAKKPSEPQVGTGNIVLIMRVDPRMRDGWIATESSEWWYSTAMDDQGRPIDGLALRFGGGAEPGATTTTQRFNFATGPWEPTTLRAKASELNSTADDPTPHLTRPEALRGGTYAALVGGNDRIIDVVGRGTVMRLCARDVAGQDHVGTMFQPASIGTQAQPMLAEYGFHFPEVRPEELTEFWLERRTINEWIEFRNVSLEPGAKTKVQVVTSDDPLPRPVVGRLRCGASVELVGVAPNPSPVRSWWRPDGSPLEQRPWEQPPSMGGAPNDPRRWFEMAVRVNGADGGAKFEPAFETPEHDAIGTWPAFNATLPQGMFACVVGYSKDRATGSLRVPVASRPWQSVVRLVPADGTRSVSEDVPGIGRASLRAPKDDREGRCVLDVIFPPDDPLRRQDQLFALGTDDRRYEPFIFFAQKSDGVNEYSVRFEVPMSKIAEIRIDSRPLDGWVEFRNVSLEAGQAREVQIITSDDEPRAPRKFEATLPDGTKIELAGVCDRTKGAWWAMDGTPLNASPKGPDDPKPGEVFGQPMALGVLVRVTAPPNAQAGETQWSGRGRDGSLVWAMDKLYRPGNVHGESDVHLLKLSPAMKDAEKLGLTIKVAATSGPWQVAARLPRPDGGWLDTSAAEAGPVYLSSPGERDGHATVRTNPTPNDMSVRVVAVYDDGTEGATAPSDAGPNGNGWTVWRPLAAVREFRYEQRPFDQWVEFRDVALKSGVQTEVTVVSASSRAAGAPTTQPRP